MTFLKAYKLKHCAKQIDDTIEAVPVGHILTYMGTKSPAHYLVCDGAEYNITDYPLLAQHIIDNFEIVNYFGGDGETTFAVPDLRGEFLRGSGTATRNTGSGAEVGEHQEPTWHIHFYTSGTASNLQHYLAPGSSSNLNADKINTGATALTGYGMTVSSFNSGTYHSYHTSRPTNTSVLYCIKYE